MITNETFFCNYDYNVISLFIVNKKSPEDNH